MSSSSSSSSSSQGRQRRQGRQGQQTQQQVVISGQGQQGGQQGQQQGGQQGQQRPVFDISNMDSGFTGILFPMKIPQRLMNLRQSLLIQSSTEPNSLPSVNLLVATWTFFHTLLKLEPNFFYDMLRHQALANARSRRVPQTGGGGGGGRIVVATPPEKKDIMDELCKSEYLKNYITNLWHGISPADLQRVLLEIVNQYKDQFELSSFEENLTSSSPKTLKELLTILCEIFATIFIHQKRVQQKKGKQNQTQKGKTSRSGRGALQPSNIF
uniref:Uncharacterized protein n=1 Tax=viral metagenome TaxID=1070528 RepID=A0A6C0D0H0_9ZZZZ